jgi:hypothetical protein
MKITSRQRGNSFEAQVAGSGGWVFADTEEMAIYRARTWPVLHNKKREAYTVWKGFKNTPTLSDLM